MVSSFLTASLGPLEHGAVLRIRRGGHQRQWAGGAWSPYQGERLLGAL